MSDGRYTNSKKKPDGVYYNKSAAESETMHEIRVMK